MHLLLKPLLQDSIGLVYDEHLHVAEQKPPRVLSVMGRRTRRDGGGGGGTKKGHSEEGLTTIDNKGRI